MADLTRITPSNELSQESRSIVFDHIFKRLASFRNKTQVYIEADDSVSRSQAPEQHEERSKNESLRILEIWAQDLLQNAWAACGEPGGEYPKLTPFTDTSLRELGHLPSDEHVSKLVNTVIFLHVTTTHGYSARTRAFFTSFVRLDEEAIADTLKNPEGAVKEAEKRTAEAREAHAEQGRTWRWVGMGLGAVAGGVLIGVTGGLAAPLVGAGVTTVLGWLGVGGTAAGLLASGLASSSVVCGALFGAYGAKSTVDMVKRHTREVRDLALVPVGKPKDTMAVRLCVSGWLSSKDDVVEPWTVFEGDDTFALQWEVEALEKLSNALYDLIKSNAMSYVKGQIIKRTILASLLSSLSPVAWLKFGKIIDNPYNNARALAIKTGKVLGNLLASRVFGNRPVTLVGYSLGSVVIFEALKYLASLPPSESFHLIEDVYLYGSPVSNSTATWSSIRRIVSGRLVNGYTSEDYVLAIVSRVSNVSWGMAGLQPVDVMGVENVECKEVDGHLKWRGMIGKYLVDCGVMGVNGDRVRLQVEKVARRIEGDIAEVDGSEEAEELKGDVIKKDDR